MNYSSEFLLESKTARGQGIDKLRYQNSQEKVLCKVKSLIFALWNGTGRITRDQVADFYEVSFETINSNYEDHKDEFEIDGVQVLDGQNLKDIKDILPISPKTSKATIYTPAGVLRMGFILRDSEVAKSVRTVAIRFIQGIGEKLTEEMVLSTLVKSYPALSSFSEGYRVRISAPLAR